MITFELSETLEYHPLIFKLSRVTNSMLSPFTKPGLEIITEWFGDKKEWAKKSETK